MVCQSIYCPSMGSIYPPNCPKWPLCHKNDKRKRANCRSYRLYYYPCQPQYHIESISISRDIEWRRLKPFSCGVTVSTSFGRGTCSVGDGPESLSVDLNEAFSHPSSHYMRQKSCETFHSRSPAYIRLEVMMSYSCYHWLMRPICPQIDQNYPTGNQNEASFGMSGLL